MKNIGLGIKLVSLTLIAVVITSGALVVLAYQSSRDDLVEAIGRRLEGIARSGVLLIDGDLHDKIQNKKDYKLDAFKTIQAALRKLKKKNNLQTEIYTFRREDKRTVSYVTMTQKKTFITHTHRITPAMSKAFSGQSSRTGVYTSENGMWISAHAPFYNSQGKISGILNIDIELKTFQAELNKKTRRLLYATAMILLFGFLLSLLFARSVVRRIRVLRDTAEQISMGAMHEVIQTDANDEIGQLAQSIERVRASLKQAMEMISADDDDDDF